MADSESPQPSRIVVFASGSGTNLQALLDAATPQWEIAGVVSDRPGCGALKRAEARSIPTAVVAWNDYANRTEFTAAVTEAAAAFNPDLIVLAGFMRILGPEAIDRFEHRIINIHPSLLPAFPGAHAVQEALAHGVKVTGVTVHFVDEKLDHGPIISQEAAQVLPDDDAVSLHRRLQTIEHRLLPQVVTDLVRGFVGAGSGHGRGSVST